MKITIQGPPIAKARPRFARRGEFVTTYSPQETEEGRWLWEALPQITNKVPGAIKLSVIFYMPRPKWHYGTGKNANILKTSAPYYHTSRPDHDNLVKFIKDCLNGQAWVDDSQVVSLIAIKS